MLRLAVPQVTSKEGWVKGGAVGGGYNLGYNTTIIANSNNHNHYHHKVFRNKSLNKSHTSHGQKTGTKTKQN